VTRAPRLLARRVMCRELGVLLVVAGVEVLHGG
jgi:hypothetical protein